jgi:hypothetical protein
MAAIQASGPMSAGLSRSKRKEKTRREADARPRTSFGAGSGVNSSTGSRFALALSAEGWSCRYAAGTVDIIDYSTRLAKSSIRFRPHFSRLRKLEKIFQISTRFSAPPPFSREAQPSAVAFDVVRGSGNRLRVAGAGPTGSPGEWPSCMKNKIDRRADFPARPSSDTAGWLGQVPCRWSRFLTCSSPFSFFRLKGTNKTAQGNALGQRFKN